jgi:hypothetical protein
MYGTIARLHPLPDRLPDLIALNERWRISGAMAATGYRAAYLVTPDENPYERPTVFLVAVFDDKESYVANAESAEQDARYRELRALLADDPEWMDGTFLGG